MYQVRKKSFKREMSNLHLTYELCLTFCVLVYREVPPRVYNLLNEGGSEEKWWEVRPCLVLFLLKLLWNWNLNVGWYDENFRYSWSSRRIIRVCVYAPFRYLLILLSSLHILGLQTLISTVMWLVDTLFDARWWRFTSLTYLTTT